MRIAIFVLLMLLGGCYGNNLLWCQESCKGQMRSFDGNKCECISMEETDGKAD